MFFPILHRAKYTYGAQYLIIIIADLPVSQFGSMHKTQEMEFTDNSAKIFLDIKQNGSPLLLM